MPSIPCLLCHGGKNRVGCPLCNGAGIHTVGGSLPEGAAGLIALKPCGCAVDWVGTGINVAFLERRLAQWRAQGLKAERCDWSAETGERLTLGAECHHPRGTPVKIIAVEIARILEDETGTITGVILLITLNDGSRRELEADLVAALAANLTPDSERRASPREAIGAPDLGDLPPTAGSDPEGA
jgi:hypothetical protein